MSNVECKEVILATFNFLAIYDISLFFLSRHSIRSEIYQINQKRLVDYFHRLLGSLRDSYRPITLVLYISDRMIPVGTRSWASETSREDVLYLLSTRKNVEENRLILN